MMKVVFKDDGTTKIVYGEVSFQDGLVKVVDQYKRTIYINKNAIVVITER